MSVASAAEIADAGLVRSEITAPGIRRRRSGRGFRYLAPDGKPLRDAEAVARIKALVIPPAWEDVWICPDANGHIQAMGTDAAGRRQYRYHDLWRELRDRDKFNRVLDFGRKLPRIREVVGRDLDGASALSRERVLAAAIRLIDLGFFRPGGDEYAAENGTYGLATIRREHVKCSRTGEVTFDYIGKSGKQHEQAVVDPVVFAVVRSLKLRRSCPDCEDLLVYRAGKRWHNVTAADINDYLHEISGDDYSAKDFRTWHATVLAAVGLAVSAAAESPTARKRAITRVVQEVASYLGNTPAVARSSYIDPRVVTLYEEGITIAPALADLGKGQEFGDAATHGRAERAVLDLLTSDKRPKPVDLTALAV